MVRRRLPSSRPLLGALLVPALFACSSEQEPAGPAETAAIVVPFAAQRPEFEALARALRDGTNPFVSPHAIGELRALLAGSSGEPLARRLELRAWLAVLLLRHGELEEALALADGAVTEAEAQDPPLDPGLVANLHRTRGLVNLRRAEVQNCVLAHNQDCCIFPLAGGGVHALAGPAEGAREDYLAYLEAFPDNLAVRWLLNVSAMAAGDHPAGVPERFLVPPAAFASEQDVGRFVDVAGELGVDAFNLCGGVVAEDFDGDGWLDIVTSSFDLDEPLRFYRNGGDGTFEERSSQSRTDDQLGGLNCVGADYDGDGDVDLFVLRGAWLFGDGRIRNSLLQNDGQGRFTDVTRAVGLAEPAAPTQTAAWGDFDGDGRLDVYVGNEAVPGEPDQIPSQLFLQRADGRFEDVAAAAGVTNDDYCKAVCAGDYDNDGRLDLYVSNQGANRLYRNRGDGTFEDLAPALGLTGPERSFAAWFFDYDDDGWLDLFVAAYEAPIAAVCADYLGRSFAASPPALYRNQGDGTFEDVAREVGLDHAYLPMGANFGDLDGDGWLDIYLATGEPELEALMPNRMLRNNRGRRFQDVTTSAGLGHLQKGHGVAFADFDHDGDQDLYHQLGGFYPADGYRNALFLNPGHGTTWVTLELVGTRSNRAAYGARVAVVVQTPGGERTVHRAVGSVSSFGGSPARQEIGLGDAERIERVEITWPSGIRQTFPDVPLEHAVRFTEGSAEVAARELVPVALPAR